MAPFFVYNSIIMEVWIILMLIIYVMILFNHYEPSIDVIVESNRHRVLLWYNTTKVDYSGRPITARSYKELFTI